MIGLYKDPTGVIVVSSEHRANMFSKRRFFQWRNITTTPDGAFQGQAFEEAKLVKAPLAPGGLPYQDAPNLLSVDQISGTGRGQRYVHIQPWARGGRGVIEGFKWAIIDYQVGITRATGTAQRCGNIEDISMAGSYAFEKTLSVKIVWERTAPPTADFTGTLTWEGRTYDLSGDVGFTHGRWKAINHTSGFEAAHGTIEWTPTPHSMPEWGEPVKPSDRLYLQWDAGAFGRPYALDFYLDRTGD